MAGFGIDVKELSPTMETKVSASEQRHVHLLPRIATGRDLAAVVLGADQFQFEHDEDQDPRSVQAMKGILNLLRQDTVRMYDAEELEKRNILVRLIPKRSAGWRATATTYLVSSEQSQESLKNRSPSHR